MFEQFPYADMQQLNLDWIIKIVKDFLDQYTQIQQLISDGLDQLDDKTQESLQALDAEKDRLEGLLNAWYTTHSQDIANELAAAVQSFITQANQAAQEAIESIPADYTDLYNLVLSLKAMVNYLPDGFFVDLTAGQYYLMNGTTIDINTPTSATGWHSAAIPCSAGNIFMITLRAVANPRVWAFIDSSGNVITSSAQEILLDREEIRAPENAAYLVVNNADNLNATPFVYQYRENYTPEEIAESVNKLMDSIPFVQGKYYTMTNGIIDLNNPASGSGWSCCKAACAPGDVFNISGRCVANPPLMAFTDSSGQVIVLDSPEIDVNNAAYTAPAGSAYIIVNNFNAWHQDPECAKVFVPEAPVRVVAADGSGDYSSLTVALLSTNSDLIVKPGTYNIVTEYKAKFGSNIFNLINDNYTTIGMFRYGLYIDKRKVVFEPGAVVECDLTGQMITDGTHRFSAICLGSNAVISGLVCRATGTFYLVHDDFGTPDNPYVNTIENCVLIGTGLVNHNVIGGGCRKHSTNIVRNCYMDNGEATERTMRYHNYNSADAAPWVIVENCRANGYIDACYYGTQATPKMTALINNCQARGVRKTAEAASMTTDNVDLYSWANTIV